MQGYDFKKGRGMEMDITSNQETVTVGQVIKQELETFWDPEPDMTQEEQTAYKNKILAKLEHGKKLSAKEMSYLRAHDPIAYQKARRLEQKRQMLETRLKQCKSKQEAEEAVGETIANISDKDPDKEALINTCQETFREFKKSHQYAELPDTKKEAQEQDKRGRYGNPFRQEEWSDDSTPLDELYEAMPTLDITG
jgi:hypothetical protein